ncbi:hypothetical protein D0C36_00960 [Mucilaginibacter conchicola]|uniref:Uncharacterized protein n=1 Tax=Mucilaginibacter conchicola TaxID=2303333 RepID=A0A372NX91_9SPHI|nr:hypothetical protein [Mucilaginibacter conchicola]RFZ94157.1 hypothetical protein D0C36_00960 [Mucilaginibacter conchicola]
MKILITAATSANAYKFKAGLNEQDIVLGDYGDIPAFTKMLKLPNPGKETYAHEMLTLSLDNAIDRIYLLDGKEWDILQHSKQLFSEYNIELIDGNNL